MNNEFEFLKEISINLDIIKSIIMYILVYYTNFKIVNKKLEFNIKSIIYILLILINAIICGLVRYKMDNLVSMIYLIITISLIFNYSNLKESFVETIISLSINYVVNLFSIMIGVILGNLIYKGVIDSYNYKIITIVRVVLLMLILKIKKLKYGFSFLRDNINNNYVMVFILNISIIVFFCGVIFENSDRIQSGNTGMQLILLYTYFVFSIKKSFQLYYKQKMLIQDLNETKEELNKKNEEIAKLEAENLSFSKKSHSLAHKQKSLEYKLNQLMMKTEVAEELDLKEKLDNISNELYSETQAVELSKTGITVIDDMLKYMQSECVTNKIDFNIQITGNIYQMINNFVSKEELEILLADHIKDAIIAINHTDNINRSILVRLGIIDGIYSLYIYDSGVEFEKETLENLGKIPITTHPDEGGTGMGFMNTFETIRKHNASLIIKEICKPSIDNYTKIIMIKFDGKEEFKIESYKNKNTQNFV